MGRTRPKTCPDCFQTVSSSCVICVCGGSISSNRSTSAAARNIGQLKRRRTERTKRGKPDFYNALEYEKQAKERKRRPTKVAKPTEPFPQKQPTPPPPHRMQLNVTKKTAENAEEVEVKEEELEEIVLSEEKIAKFSLILDEINKKICASSWQAFV